MSLTRSNPFAQRRREEEAAGAELEQRLDVVWAHLRTKDTPRRDSAYMGVYCSTCDQDALPLRDGTCGFCDSKIAEAYDRR